MDTTTISDPANEQDDAPRNGKNGTPSSRDGYSGFNSRAERYPFRPGTPQAGTRGPATSALTRDAARLRSIMVQATERVDAEQKETGDEPAGMAADGARQSDGTRRRGDLARAVDAPPFPDLGAPERTRMSGIEDLRDSALSQSSLNESDRDSSSRRPTMLRMPGEREMTPSPGSAPSSEHGVATRLRPVAALITEPDAIINQAMADREEDAPVSNAVEREEFLPEADVPAVEMKVAGAAMHRQEPLPFSAYDPDPTGAMAPDPIRISVDDPPPMTYARLAREAEAGGKRRVVLMATMVVIGTTIGVGLYAGGGDFLSGIFSNRTEGVAVQSPSAVTERPIVEQPVAPAPAPVDAIPERSGLNGSTQTPAAVEPQPATVPESVPVPPVPREDIAEAPVPAAIETRGEPRVRASEPDSSPAATRLRAERAAAERGERAAAEKAKKEAEKKPEPEKGAARSGKYLVQVRATTDEAEAKLIARRLRAKGASGVAIVPSEKNGTTHYRVRFTSTGSDQAKELASKAGYGNVWVIKQK